MTSPLRFDPVRWAERRRSAMQMAADMRRKRTSENPSSGEPILTRQSLAPNSVYRAESRESKASAENDQPKKNWEWNDNTSTKPSTGVTLGDTGRSSRKPPVPYQVRRREEVGNVKRKEESVVVKRREDAVSARRKEETGPITSRAVKKPLPTPHRGIVKPVVRRQQPARAPPPPPPNDNDPVTRQMIDRDTLRLGNKLLFEKGIKFWRDKSGLDCSRTNSVNVSMQSVSDSSEKESAIRVYVRKRPLFTKELEKEFDVVWVPHTSSVVLHNCLFQADLKTAYITHSTFKFDGCFSEYCGNDEIFSECQIGQMLKESMNGRVSTLFMFGQTGSGKTYTMTAIEEFVCDEIFSPKSLSSSPPEIKLEFIELCGKKVFDLLVEERGESLKLRERGDGSLLIDGVSSCEILDADDLKTQIRSAHARRHTESTGANSVSSRSHALCIFRFPETGGKLVLVDLAGSERRKDSMWHDKERQREGAEINASLHALKECIRWRVSRNRSNGPPAPFRLSSLTRILAEAFTQPNSRLSVIATVSPCATDIEHTVSTLRSVHALTSSSRTSSVEEIKQTDLDKIKDDEKFSGGPSFLATPPKKWNYDQISEWLVSVAGPTDQVFPKGTNGQMLIRMSESRFVQLYGEKMGIKLYRDLHDLILKSGSNRTTAGTRI